MRGFFDDLLAAIFVLAVLAASYVFLFMGTVQSGTMMSNALQHRIKIEKLQSAVQAFQHITEPNTEQKLSYLVGLAAQQGSSRVWVGNQRVDAVSASESALNELLGSNYQLSVEVPVEQVSVTLIMPQSPTLLEEKNKLISVIPDVRNQLGETGINATLSVLFLSYDSCSYTWCDEDVQEEVECFQRLYTISEGDSHYNLGDSIVDVSQDSSLGLKVIIPFTDSLSTGTAPDSCYSACNFDSSCVWCSQNRTIHRAEQSLREAGVYAKSNNALVCPLLTDKCSSLSEEALNQFSCLGFSNPEASCVDCEACYSTSGGICFQNQESAVEEQFSNLARLTGCESVQTSSQSLKEDLLEQVKRAFREKEIVVGMNPPEDVTLYSEDLILTGPLLTQPLKARLVVW